MSKSPPFSTVAAPPIHLQTGCKMKPVSKFATSNILAADPGKNMTKASNKINEVKSLPTILQTTQTIVDLWKGFSMDNGIFKMVMDIKSSCWNALDVSPLSSLGDVTRKLWSFGSFKAEWEKDILKHGMVHEGLRMVKHHNSKCLGSFIPEM